MLIARNHVPASQLSATTFHLHQPIRFWCPLPTSPFPRDPRARIYQIISRGKQMSGQWRWTTLWPISTRKWDEIKNLCSYREFLSAVVIAQLRTSGLPIDQAAIRTREICRLWLIPLPTVYPGHVLKYVWNTRTPVTFSLPFLSHQYTAIRFMVQVRAEKKVSASERPREKHKSFQKERYRTDHWPGEKI